MHKFSALRFLSLLLLTPAIAAATGWTVPNGSSIQVFIDQAGPGDRISVEPGEIK